MNPAGISFWVPGVPQPGGSKKGFVNPRNGRVVIVEDAKNNKPWRQSVQVFALQEYKGPPLGGALSLSIRFVMPRPKGHYRTGKFSELLKDSAPTYHTKKPDTTKLIRSTEDALTGILWRDDAQVVSQTVVKTYGPVPGAHIMVEVVAPGREG
jgi:Holliday junction resolvase RusA-like endonuclease